MTYEEILAKMKATYRELSGFDADNASDIGIRLKVLAAETASVYEKIAALKTQVFPQTSTGECLELHAQTRAITRKAAIPASGMLTFSRETPAFSDIVIPAGIVCATKPDPRVRFETVSDCVIPFGGTTATAVAVAIDPGNIGNVAANSVVTMMSPASGVTSVSNPEPFSGGVDEESDDALRSRLLSAYENISNGTNSAFYYDLAMSYDGVSSANVLPRKRGRGTVDVVVTCRDETVQAQIVAAINAELNKRKEINVDVAVMAAVREYPAVSVEIAIKDGYNFELVAEKSRAEIERYISGLGVGASLLLAEMGNCLLSVDGVYNYKVLTPSKDVTPASDRVLRPDLITVNRMAVG